MRFGHDGVAGAAVEHHDGALHAIFPELVDGGLPLPVQETHENVRLQGSDVHVPATQLPPVLRGEAHDRGVVLPTIKVLQLRRAVLEAHDLISREIAREDAVQQRRVGVHRNELTTSLGLDLSSFHFPPMKSSVELSNVSKIDLFCLVA